MPISFGASSFLNYPITSFSLKWYEVALSPFPWFSALKNSLIIACITTILATSLGTLAAVGLNSLNSRLKVFLSVLLIAPMVVPIVISALAFYFFFANIGLLGTFTGMIVAHTVLATPFVIVTVSATLKGFDNNLVRAASSLGAGRLTAFRTVTLPMIFPGVVTGSIFAFITSFDEVIVALFVASPAQYTLPRRLFEGLRDQLDPSIVAVAVMLMVFSTILLAAVVFLRWRTERITGVIK